MKKKIYCDVCDKFISNKSSHKKTETHKTLSLSIVNRFYIKNIDVETIDYVINKHVDDYNKKFLNFYCCFEIRNDNFCCRMNSGLVLQPFIGISEKLIRQYKNNQKKLVNLKIMFVTDLERLSYNQYLQQPRQMIERRICKIIDCNPNLMKTLNKMARPYKWHIVKKYWGFVGEGPWGKECIIVPANWQDLEPNI